MSVDDAVALADDLLAAYGASDRQELPGPDLLWADQLARVLRELAMAVSVRHVTPVSGQPVAVITHPQQARPGGRRRGGGVLVRMMRAWAFRGAGPETVVLSSAEAGTVRVALADAGAWHGVYGDCAACVAEGRCADPARHVLIARDYAALRARLNGEAR